MEYLALNKITQQMHEEVIAQRQEQKKTNDLKDLGIERVTLSASIIDPSVDVSKLSQMDQMLMIMEEVKKREMLDKILKVGLLVYDMKQFAPLNVEYVKYFGLKPPVRVCVEIPSDELIVYFMVWNNFDKQK